MINKIHHGDARRLIHQLDDESVHCIVTSPPYFGLRDYGVDGQMGLEKTPEEFVDGMVCLFRDCRKKLRDDGTLWLNIGDSYAGYHGNKKNPIDSPSNKNGYTENMRKSTVHRPTSQKSSTLQGGKSSQIEALRSHENVTTPGLKPKDLIGIPWMLAFALRADGWYLRQDIIWHKPNPMPESITDRCTKAHEYIFLLSKSQRYYYDYEAIMVESKDPKDDLRRLNGSQNGHKSNPDELKNGLRPRNWNGSSFDKGKTGEMKATHGHTRKSGNLARKPGSDRGLPSNGIGSDLVSGNVAGSVPWEGMKANKRSVWTVPTHPLTDAHFATFPERLIIDCIKAGCPENGVVLDPFMGAGTTALVARKLYRKFIGFELNEKYIKMAENRLHSQLGMFV